MAHNRFFGMYVIGRITFQVTTFQVTTTKGPPDGTSQAAPATCNQHPGAATHQQSPISAPPTTPQEYQYPLPLLGRCWGVAGAHCHLKPNPRNLSKIMSCKCFVAHCYLKPKPISTLKTFGTSDSDYKNDEFWRFLVWPKNICWG